MKSKIYLGAGHSNQPGRDMGAPPASLNIGYTEGIETVKFRTEVFNELLLLGHSPVMDNEANEGGKTVTLYKSQVKENDIACDLHFNSFTSKATGVEVVVSNTASDQEKKLAAEIASSFAGIMCITNRGVKTETQSARGRLGWFTIPCKYRVLVEVCFITNPGDMSAYVKNKTKLAYSLATILNAYAK